MDDTSWATFEQKLRTELKYIELISRFTHNGPAWIGLISFSKSGKTVYFDGKAFQRIGSDRTHGNFYDIESGDEYWISGIKKNMTDRHKFGGGKIFVEKRILSEYLKVVGKCDLPKTEYELIKVETEIPLERIREMENEKIEREEFSSDLYFKKPNELTKEEIQFLLADLEESANSPQYKKTRRSIKSRRIELENELDKRGIKNVG